MALFEKKELSKEKLEELTTLMKSFIDMGIDKYLSLWNTNMGKRGPQIMLFHKVKDKELYREFMENIARPHKIMNVKYNEINKQYEIDECVLRAMEKLDSWRKSDVSDNRKILKVIGIEWDIILNIGVGFKTDNRQWKLQTAWVFSISQNKHPNLYDKYKNLEKIQWSDSALIY